VCRCLCPRGERTGIGFLSPGQRGGEPSRVVLGKQIMTRGGKTKWGGGEKGTKGTEVGKKSRFGWEDFQVRGKVGTSIKRAWKKKKKKEVMGEYGSGRGKRGKRWCNSNNLPGNGVTQGEVKIAAKRGGKTYKLGRGGKDKGKHKAVIQKIQGGEGKH